MIPEINNTKQQDSRRLAHTRRFSSWAWRNTLKLHARYIFLLILISVVNCKSNKAAVFFYHCFTKRKGKMWSFQIMYVSGKSALFPLCRKLQSSEALNTFFHLRFHHYSGLWALGLRKQSTCISVAAVALKHLYKEEGSECVKYLMLLFRYCTLSYSVIHRNI